MKKEELRAKLVDRLQKTSEGEDVGIVLDRWYECVWAVREAIQELDLGFDIGEYNETDGEVIMLATAYIEKLGLAVVLDWDAYEEVNSYEELADLLLKLDKQARDVRHSIKIRRKKE